MRKGDPSGSSLALCMGQYATHRSIIYRKIVTDFRYTQITRPDRNYFLSRPGDRFGALAIDEMLISDLRDRFHYQHPL